MLTRTQLSAWTKALRDNPEKQGRGFLNMGDKFCCLGMFCELQGVPKEVNLHGIATYHFGERLVDESPRLVRGKQADYFGGSGDGRFAAMGMPYLEVGSRTYVTLADANDADVPWSVLADHLDKHYPVSSKD
jgi:hypothetical protein